MIDLEKWSTIDRRRYSNKYIKTAQSKKRVNYFYFEKNGWQYLFRVHPEVSNVISPELLVELADSIN
ncbi:hypothetical protein SAMN05878482_109107 [Peribacillus simplex]|uniref:Uncharacterized protein n=1 Tax=Peribacillus simplex TaxID=1478 RepID=A0A9X8RDQ5_9BACI|nr:hypothetical protein SAMN05878482_109107 [Peribacillus simplex]